MLLLGDVDEYSFANAGDMQLMGIPILVRQHLYWEGPRMSVGSIFQKLYYRQVSNIRRTLVGN